MASRVELVFEKVATLPQAKTTPQINPVPPKSNPGHGERLPFKSDREHNRHRRKYAEGQLSAEKCFYFRGPNGSLNLRAQNLIVFCQLAEGIDDETWLFHFGRKDFSHWFRDCINDEDLAAETELIAGRGEMSVAESKTLILAAIQRKYILLSTSRLSVPGAM